MKPARHMFGGVMLLLAGSLAAEDAATPADAVMALGKDVYLARCVVCHKEDGIGGQGGAPSLVGNFRLRDARRVLQQILDGGQYMPGFAFLLSDAEIAGVSTYIRNSWSNTHGAVAKSQVSELRSE